MVLLALGRNALEYLHAEFTLVVYNRDAGAVNKTYAGAFSETGKTQEHCQGPRSNAALPRQNGCTRTGAGTDASIVRTRMTDSNA